MTDRKTGLLCTKSFHGHRGLAHHQDSIHRRYRFLCPICPRFEVQIKKFDSSFEHVKQGSKKAIPLAIFHPYPHIFPIFCYVKG